MWLDSPIIENRRAFARSKERNFAGQGSLSYSHVRGLTPSVEGDMRLLEDINASVERSRMITKSGADPSKVGSIGPQMEVDGATEPSLVSDEKKVAADLVAEMMEKLSKKKEKQVPDSYWKSLEGFRS